MSMHDKCSLVDTAGGLADTLKEHDHIIALFYASWCPFCVKILPDFKKHAEEGANVFLLVKDDQEVMADHYSVAVYPTAIHFEKGLVSKRLDGVLGVGLRKKQLEDFIASCS